MTISSSSTSSFYDASATQLSSLTSQLDQIQNEISTGSSIPDASADPLGASQMRTLQAEDTASKIDTAAANSATADLTLASTSLSQFANTVTQIKQLATEAANGTSSTSDSQAIGQQVSQLEQTLVGLANTRDSEGNALFGGQTTGQAYSVDASGNATYVGTSTSKSLPLGDGQSVTTSVTGPEFLDFQDSSGNSTNLLTVVKNLATALKAGGTTAQAAANQSLDTLSNGLDAINNAQTIVGSRMAWVNLDTQSQTAMSTARATEESTVGDTNVTTAAVKLQELSTALQASQESFAKLSGLSLFDYIK